MAPGIVIPAVLFGLGVPLVLSGAERGDRERLDRERLDRDDAERVARRDTERRR